MPSDARRCAHAVVRRVFEQGAYADRAFRGESRLLEGRDRALAMRLAFGAVQRAGTLDWAIERLAGRAPEKLDGAVLAALRVGLYELLYLDGSPDYAVLAESVELVKRAGSHGHGLVNAVLRRALRERDDLLARVDDSSAASAAIVHSHPVWLAEMWWETLGEDQARALMAEDNEPPERSVRVNTLVSTRDQVVAELPELREETPTLRGFALPEAVIVDGGFDLTGSRLWRSGALIAQSRAAILVGRALGPRPGERVLDLCAAPGGKTTHLAALMDNRGEVVAVEKHGGRVRELRQTVERMGATIVTVIEADAAAGEPAEILERSGDELFDRVLLDAPCSGLGTLQSHPDLRWRASRERIAELAELQGRLLRAAAACVRDGGTLVYSTCTISPPENEHQIEALLKSRPDFALDPICAGSAAARAEPTAGAASAIGVGRAIQTMPHIDGTAGFFIARLMRSMP